MVLTEWRKPTPEMQEYLKRRMLSVTSVCARTFDDHEWVSESKNVEEEEEEVMGSDLDYEICIPCSGVC